MRSTCSCNARASDHRKFIENIAEIAGQEHPGQEIFNRLHPRSDQAFPHDSCRRSRKEPPAGIGKLGVLLQGFLPVVGALIRSLPMATQSSSRGLNFWCLWKITGSFSCCEHVFLLHIQLCVF